VHDIPDTAHGLSDYRGIANVAVNEIDRLGFRCPAVQGANRESLRQQKTAQLDSQESCSAGHQY
jgi:hypothetical protein